MSTNEEVIKVIRDYCQRNIFDKESVGVHYRDEYKPTWRKRTRAAIGPNVSGEALSRYTTSQIQKEVIANFGAKDIQIEKQVIPGSDLAFDLWNTEEKTAFEICLGSIKNEFHKDVLKGLLDNETVELVILYREYSFEVARGKTYRDRTWFDAPAQKNIIERAEVLNLRVRPLTLVP